MPNFAIVVMGVSGSGKSTIGQLLARRFGCRFMEGDAFHSDASIAKMRAGVPLDDEDRWPWLDQLGASLGQAARTDGIAIAACSALKRRYRDRLRGQAGCPVAFVHLAASPDELARRVAGRESHYMPASLLDSQLTILEPPQADEWSRTFPVEGSASDPLEAILSWLHAAHDGVRGSKAGIE